jgi:hypothetical protein
MSDNISAADKWWHTDNNDLALQLSVGIRNELKHRILHTNIKREKLQLDECSQRIRELFQREITRYTKRLEAAAKKQSDLGRVDLYRRIARRLHECNLSLARKCRKNNVAIEAVVVHGKATCYR